MNDFAAPFQGRIRSDRGVGRRAAGDYRVVRSSLACRVARLQATGEGFTFNITRVEAKLT
jgi:hypothetical protein